MLYYKLNAIRHPLIKGKEMYHAQLLPCTPVLLSDFYDELAEESCVTSADIRAVMDRLERIVLHAMCNGRSVRLGTFGSFHVNMLSRGTEKKEDFTMKNIQRLRVRYEPSPKMKRDLALNSPKVRLTHVK